MKDYGQKFLIEMNKVKDWYDKVSGDMPKVLEIGCETCEKTIIDISSAMVKKQKVLCLDAYKISEYFPENTFDEVRAFGSLEGADFYRIIEQVDKILKKGGIFKFRVQRDVWWIKLYCKYIRKHIPKDDWIKVIKYNIKTIKVILHKYNFKIYKRKFLNWGAIYEIWAYK